MNINIHYLQVVGPWEQLMHLVLLALRTRSADIQAACKGTGSCEVPSLRFSLLFFFRHLTALGIPHSLG